MDILEARKKAKTKSRGKGVKKRRKKIQPEEKKPAKKDEIKDAILEASQDLAVMEEGLEKIEEREEEKALIEALEGKVEDESSGETVEEKVEMDQQVFQETEKKEEDAELSFADVAAAELLKQAEAQKALGEEVQFLAFRLGKEFFAVEIHHIREIVKPRSITPVPGVSEHILGITSVRGNIMPVVDVGYRIGMFDSLYDPGNWDKKTRFVIFNFDRVLVSMVVQEVAGVIKAFEEEVEPVPPTVTGPASEYLVGIIRRDSDIYTVISIREVFDFLFKAEGD